MSDWARRQLYVKRKKEMTDPNNGKEEERENKFNGEKINGDSSQ